MNELSTKNILLDEVEQLNKIVESSFFTLALKLAQVEESGAYTEAGYETYTAYVIDKLGKSKSFASKMLKVGKFIHSSGFSPETLDTTYPRLYASINALPDASPEEVISNAITLSESELITKKQVARAGKHEPNFMEICTICKVDKTNHD